MLARIRTENNMLKSIAAIVVSYLAMFVFFMAVVIACYVALGSERVFKPDSYEISTLWLVLTVIVSFVASAIAGYLCAVISGSWTTCRVFAFLVFLATLGFCISSLRQSQESPNVRASEVAYTDGIRLGVSPMWLHFVSPVISGVAVLVGARMKRRGEL
jgi:archaellum biogenesis protein FlaJ (TadC family)